MPCLRPSGHRYLQLRLASPTSQEVAIVTINTTTVNKDKDDNRRGGSFLARHTAAKTRFCMLCSGSLVLVLRNALPVDVWRRTHRSLHTTVNAHRGGRTLGVALPYLGRWIAAGEASPSASDKDVLYLRLSVQDDLDRSALQTAGMSAPSGYAESHAPALGPACDRSNAWELGLAARSIEQTLPNMNASVRHGTSLSAAANDGQACHASSFGCLVAISLQ